MEGNGEKLGKWGGDGELAGIAHGVLVADGCGGVSSKEMGEKWHKMPIFHSPMFPPFPEIEDLPQVPS